MLVLVMIVIFIPLLEQKFGIFDRTDILYGSYEIKKDTVLTPENWFNRRYQQKKEDFVNENFGFRNFLVKLNNEIEFSFYKDLHVNDVFLGKNNYLYGNTFYQNYTGRTFKQKYADSVFKTITQLNESLKAKNVKLLVCFAPCKESFYPEFLPDTNLAQVKDVNFYTYYQKKLKVAGVPLLDYDSYFRKLKPTAEHPLFTQGAVHWTTYGAYIALDTLLRRVAFETGKKVNTFHIKDIELSDTARLGDDDITKAMNLLRRVNTEKLAYPTIEYEHNNDSCEKPKVMIIGDSFFYGLNNTWIPGKVFSKETYFLYYFKTANPFDPSKKGGPVEELDLNEELKNTDIVILFFSTGHLDGLPYGADKLTKLK
ncbi:MAG: sugar O-acetyltransferase precursor [Bacteroidetes bacterium]|nr:sugar O-acetyltransferase precursor [Bacteroidota bacterium]